MQLNKPVEYTTKNKIHFGFHSVVSLTLFYIAYELYQGYLSFMSLDLEVRTYADDLDVRWFLKIYAVALIVIGIVIILSALYRYVKCSVK